MNEPPWRSHCPTLLCDGELHPARPPGGWKLFRVMQDQPTHALGVFPLRCDRCGVVVFWSGYEGDAPWEAEELRLEE